MQLRLGIIALKSSIDGLIFFGSSEETEPIEQAIFQHLIFSKNQMVRQVTIEGVCKMLFSTRLTGALKDECSQENMVAIVAHLLIQWFDKRHNRQN